MVKNLDGFLTDILSGFGPKQNKVLTERFGLKTGQKATLQEIGDSLGITRERVRQIEEQAVKKVRVAVMEKANKIIEFAEKHLETAGGIRRHDHFIADLKQLMPEMTKTRHADNKLTFIFSVSGRPQLHKEDDRFHGFWFVNEADRKKLFDFAQKMVSFFKEKGKKEIIDNRAHLLVCKDFNSCHLISVSKEFGTNVFGDVGLKEWEEIDPRTIRDKIYLVLKKNKKPLHFSEIAGQINALGIDKKNAHTQTVHNELIKDAARFVLVGRGLYALREHGFEPGTVREVIARLIKKHGPLKPEKVLDLVNQERILKKNTILLNLQNKRYFKRLTDGRYGLV